MKTSSTKVPNGNGSLYKEVRFSPTASPNRRTQSVPSSDPSGNMDYAREARRTVSSEESYSELSGDYIQRSRSLLEHQRQNFENERTLFAEERQLWETERTLLRRRISELEALLRGRGGASGSDRPYHPSQSRVYLSTEQNSYDTQGTGALNKPTRVFLETDNPHGLSAPVPDQGGAPLSLDAALSPQSQPTEPLPAAGGSVPIEKLDSTLDGINLKSSGLPPDIVARVMTPPSPPPLDTLPSAPAPLLRKPSMERRNSLKLKLSDLRQPDRNLTRDAGHTPMAVIDASADTEQQSIGEGTPPEVPAETERKRPREKSESYFPDVSDDPALKGPLSLLNDEDHDKGFLSELDQKLLDQAKQGVLDAAIPKAQTETYAEPPSQGDLEPELKFKNTTNFGTAFGAPNVGEGDLPST